MRRALFILFSHGTLPESQDGKLGATLIFILSRRTNERQRKSTAVLWRILMNMKCIENVHKLWQWSSHGCNFWLCKVLCCNSLQYFCWSWMLFLERWGLLRTCSITRSPHYYWQNQSNICCTTSTKPSICLLAAHNLERVQSYSHTAPPDSCSLPAVYYMNLFQLVLSWIFVSNLRNQCFLAKKTRPHLQTLPSETHNLATTQTDSSHLYQAFRVFPNFLNQTHGQLNL